MTDRWELYQRRVFGVLTPCFIAALLTFDELDADGLSDPYTPVLLILLASYGTGLTAYLIKKLGGVK